MKNKIYFIFLIVIFLTVWQLVTFTDINKILYPSPYSVFTSIFQSPDLITDIAISLIRLIVGSIVGILFGIIFGILTGHIRMINESIGRFSNFFRFIPPLALVPLFLLWFGIGEFSKISLMAWACFFPVWISTHNGVKNIENKYLLVAKSLKIKGFYLLKEVILKGSLGYTLNGARIGVGMAFSVLIVAEMIGAYAGLGYRIFFLQSVYRVDRMIAYILVIGILGIIIDKVFLFISKRLTPWKNEE